MDSPTAPFNAVCVIAKIGPITRSRGSGAIKQLDGVITRKTQKEQLLSAHITEE